MAEPVIEGTEFPPGYGLSHQATAREGAGNCQVGTAGWNSNKLRRSHCTEVKTTPLIKRRCQTVKNKSELWWTCDALRVSREIKQMEEVSASTAHYDCNRGSEEREEKMSFRKWSHSQCEILGRTGGFLMRPWLAWTTLKIHSPPCSAGGAVTVCRQWTDANLLP